MTGTVKTSEDRAFQTLEHVRTETTDSVEGVAPFEAAQYVDPAIAAREREQLFGRVPSIVAHRSELAEPGDFLTVQMPRNRVIAVRQYDGGLKAFVNLNHQGWPLDEQGRASVSRFTCKDGCFYDLAGQHHPADTNTRIGASGSDDPVAGHDTDAAEQPALVELPIEERHGLVWLVDRAGTSIDLAEWLGPDMDAVLSSYDLPDMVCFRFEAFDEPTNWKLMQDAFIDAYHIQYAHPNTAAKHIYTNIQTVEDFGRHSRVCAPRKSISRYLDDDPAGLDGSDLASHVTDSHFLLPNSTLLRQPDNHFELLTFRPHPTEPGRCTMEMRLLVPRVENSSLPLERWNRVWEKNWDILISVLLQEDFPLLRASQSGMASADAGPMLLGRNEVINHIFHREYAALMA